MRSPPAHGLSDNALVVARIGGVFTALSFGLVLSIFSSLLAFVNPWLILVAIPAILAPLLLYYVVIRPRLLVRWWRYEVGEHEVYLQRGIITLERRLIPLVRVQNVDTSHGPIDRRFGVASVTISTAGGQDAIPLLDDAVAEELRARINARAQSQRSLEVLDAG